MADAARRQLVSTIKLVINAGAAKPSPPVGPALGQAGLNIMGFCKEFNAKTSKHKDGIPLRVSVRVFSDKTYEWSLGAPPASWLIKRAAGLERASMRPGHELVACVSLKHLYAIAQLKQSDAPSVPLAAIVSNLMASCRSMGVEVVTRPEDAKQY